MTQDPSPPDPKVVPKATAVATPSNATELASKGTPAAETAKQTAVVTSTEPGTDDPRRQTTHGWAVDLGHVREEFAKKWGEYLANASWVLLVILVGYVIGDNLPRSLTDRLGLTTPPTRLDEIYPTGT